MKTRVELNEEKQEEIEKEEKTNKRKKRIKITLLIILPLILFISISYFILTYIGNINVIVREYPIYSNKVTNDFNGLKIVHFSDILYPSVNIDKIKKTINVINNTNPDIVIFTGNIINKDINISNEKELLINEFKNIKAKYGKYAIKGLFDNNDALEVLKNSSFEILDNTITKIYINNSYINIVGYTNKNDLSIDDKYTIFLTSYPDNTDNIINYYNPDLILTGYSLNGNINLPFIGGLIKYNNAKKYYNRHYEIGNTKLFISGGIGNKNINFRLFNHPSINFYRLRISQ